MRVIYILLFFVFPGLLSAQVQPGFDKGEALEMIRICNSHTFLEIYSTDRAIIPSGYTRIYSSTPNIMDNMFQVYTRGKTGVIHFRGSTVHPNSWIENLYSAMIPAMGSMTVYDRKRAYRFAGERNAAVHSGFALGVVLMSDEIIQQVQVLNRRGVYNILITGHSQGGALATMTHAYLENLEEGVISSGNTFKMYAFANPMTGNEVFADEYNEQFTAKGLSFRIINPGDIVASLPFTYSDEEMFSAENIISWLSGEEEFDIGKLGLELIMRKFKDGLSSYIKKSNQLLHKLIAKQAGEIVFPDYVDDIKYVSVGELHKLKPFSYPEIIRDSSEIAPGDLSDYEPLPDGRYKKKEPRFFQHKPYNYYVNLAREYSEQDYRKIRMKYLKENL